MQPEFGSEPRSRWKHVFGAGRTAFNPSRRMFWLLGPIVALFAVGWSFLVYADPPPRAPVMAVGMLGGPAVLLLLGLYDAKRFWWAWRILTGLLGFGFLAGILYMALGGSIDEPGFRAWQFIAGFVVLGIPCLLHTVFGRFGLPEIEETAPTLQGAPRRGVILLALCPRWWHHGMVEWESDLLYAIRWFLVTSAVLLTSLLTIYIVAGWQKTGLFWTVPVVLAVAFLVSPLLGGVVCKTLDCPFYGDISFRDWLLEEVGESRLRELARGGHPKNIPQLSDITTCNDVCMHFRDYYFYSELKAAWPPPHRRTGSGKFNVRKALEEYVIELGYENLAAMTNDCAASEQDSFNIALLRYMAIEESRQMYSD